MSRPKRTENQARPAPEETMTRTDQDRFRHALRALRARLTGDVSHLTDEAFRNREDSNGSAAPLHPADQGTDNYEQEFTLSLLANQEQTIEEIDEALDRLHKGTFGQ